MDDTTKKMDDMQKKQAGHAVQSELEKQKGSVDTSVKKHAKQEEEKEPNCGCKWF